MKNTLLTILFMSALSILYGQNMDLEGKVIGQENEELISATVVILSQTDSTLVSFILTDGSGVFKLSDLEYGDYILQVTYLGYNQYAEPISVNKNSPSILPDIQLQVAQNSIEQIEIQGEHVPMVVKKDTLEYNAAAFQTQPNEVVEDLLKKLPGVEVDDDGTITAQGEEVQKVTVDGKDFFGDDPTIATRNLPADAINKVQIFDEKSDMAQFSGVDDGEREKTINLELKEDRRQGQFGTLEAGYGTDSRYKGRLSLNRFSTKTQISAIGNFNNINEQGFSSSDYVSFMQGVGFRGRGSGLAVNRGLSNGFVTTNAGGININHNLTNTTDLIFSYFLNDISNNIESLVLRENFARNESYFDDEAAAELTSSTNHRFRTELEIEIDSSQNLDIEAGLVYNNGGSTYNGLSERLSDDLSVQNRSEQDYINDGTSLNATGRISYRKNFGTTKKRTLTFQTNLNDTSSDSDGDLISGNTFFDDNGTANIIEDIVQEQLQKDDGNNYRLQVSFVEPIQSNKFLEFKYTRQNFNNELRREVEDIISGTATFNEDLSNNYKRDYVYDRPSVTLHHNSDMTNISLEAAFQNAVLQGDIISEDIQIENRVFRFLPRINLRHEFGQSHNIRLRYSTNVNDPSIEQLQPVPDNSDPINIYQGNPDLVPEYRHVLRLNYIKYDQFSFRSFFAFINARYIINNITNQTILDDEFRQITQPLNVDYDFNISGNLNFSSPIKLFKTRINVGTRLSYQNSLVFINAVENVRNRITSSVNARLENRNKKVIDWELGGNYSFNTTRFNLSDRDQSFANQRAFGEITYNIKQYFSISTTMNVNFYSEEQFGEAMTIPIWKGSISKYLLDQKLEIKLSAFDLLNQNIGISRTNGVNFIENSEITSLGRFGMLSIIYSIRNNNQASGNSSGGGGRGNRGRG
jgi:hypothetical protein